MGRRKKGEIVNGWVCLDKPFGMGSTEAVSKVVLPSENLPGVPWLTKWIDDTPGSAASAAETLANRSVVADS